jgi:hypothetical protein
MENEPAETPLDAPNVYFKVDILVNSKQIRNSA